MNLQDDVDASAQATSDMHNKLATFYMELINPRMKMRKGDYISFSFALSLEHLYGLTNQEKFNSFNGCGRITKRSYKWSFQYSVHSTFGKSLDDVYRIFLRWTGVELEDGRFLYDATMAFRRIKSYATWLDKSGKQLHDPPLNDDDMKIAQNVLKFTHSYDKHGRLVMWRNLPKIKIEEHKKLSSNQIFRAAAWYVHFAMFDESAEKHGLIMVVSFSESDKLPWVLAQEFRVNVSIQGLTLKASNINLVNIIYTNVKIPWLRSMWGSLWFVMPTYVQESFHFYEDGRREVAELVGDDYVPEDFGIDEGRNCLENVETTS